MTVFADIPTVGGFFKPDQYEGAHAILVEPTSLERQRPSNFGPKDTIHANLTIFNTAADLDAGNAVEEQGTLIQHMALVRDLIPLVGKATVVTVGDAPSAKPGQRPAKIWRKVPNAVQQKVVAYVQERDAALEAAKSEMPSFLA